MGKNTFNLSRDEEQAILAALPLLDILDLEENADQQDMNRFLSQSVECKLNSRNATFAVDEFRIMYAAVVAARELQRGVFALDLDPEHKSLLNRYFFIYTALVPKLEKLISRLLQSP